MSIENSGFVDSGVNITVSLRIDEETAKEVKKIALYERAKPGTLMRMWVQDKVRVYRRNPDYKRWLKLRDFIPLKSESEKRERKKR